MLLLLLHVSSPRPVMSDNPPVFLLSSSGLYIIFTLSSVLMCFLEGLMHIRKKYSFNLYFNLYLTFIFYDKLPETGGVFVFFFSIPPFGRANVKDVHLNVGEKKCILSHSAFFYV